MAQPPPLAEVAMYSECASLTESIQERVLPRVVLNSYPAAVGREVVRSVLSPLSRGLAGREKAGEEASCSLQTREEVEWTMEVLGYGLQLPDADLVSSCIDVYEDWLSSFSPSPSPSVPPPVAADPNLYCHTILSHLYQLFLPRDGTRGAEFPPGTPQHLQSTVCERALTITQSLLMRSGDSLSDLTCEAISSHLLSVADLLLSPPHSPSSSSLAGHLSTQLTHTLFTAWLRTCTSSFPAPHLWRTLRELCLRWRHHLCLAQQWSFLMYSLTLRVVRLLYSPHYLSHLKSHLLLEDPQFSQILESIPPDSLVQCWFRMLNTLGNPVELSYLSTFSSLPLFQKMAGESGEPLSVSSLSLPLIFHEALRGVAQMVHLFLANEPRPELPRPLPEGSVPLLPPPGSAKSSPHGLRRKGSREYRDRGNVTGPSNTGGGKKPTWYVDTPSPRLPAPASRPPPVSHPLLTDIKRPRGNTLLHLFGSWLFEAASRPLQGVAGDRRRTERSAVFHSLVDLNSSIDSTQTTPPDDHAQFEAGQAEAFGALCAVFSSQPCGEPFLPVYLARFYHCLRLGLTHQEASQGQVVTRILLNSPSLFRKGLPGLNLLLPHFLSALDLVLPHPTPQVRCAVSTRELRHASIQLLLSVLPLPLHFLHQSLPAMPEAEEGVGSEGMTFYGLREWMLWLLFSAIAHEGDSTNLQLLLHGVLVCLQDTVLYENVVTRLAEEGGDSNSQRTDFFSSVDKDYGSASLFRRACKAGHWCLLTWQNNIHVSLSALELLQGLARLQFEYIDHVDLNMAVMWVCEYIHHRAEKDKLLHSKDLHTSIVAAFSCLLNWVTLHPYLLGDKTTLDAVMQVVELGISGTFSQSPSGQAVYKGEKELKPISGRVKDIAEFVLTCIMEQVGAFPLPCGAETTSSLLNEEHLLAKLPVAENQGAAFKYFLLDNATVLGLLEARFTADAGPSLMAVVRGLSGRHCWHIQLRMKPHSTQGVVAAQCESMPRPAPCSPLPPSPSSLTRSPWPEEACDGAELELDDSIPSLDSVLNADGSGEEYGRMAELVSREMELEAGREPDPPSLPLQPPHRTEGSIETGRLLLSHLNLLGIDTLQAGQKRSLVMLDGANPGLQQALGGLDRLPTRFCNTLFLLYCREGSLRAEEVLAQQSQPAGRQPEFSEFLQGLGWSVDPVGHAGFSGKIRQEKSEEPGRLLQFGAQLSQQSSFLYYSDSVTEMAFVQPVLSPSASHSSASLRSVESSDSGQDAVSLVSKSSLPAPLAAPDREPLSSQTSLPFLHHAGPTAGEGERFNTLPFRGKLSSNSRSDLHSSSDTPRKKSGVPQDCAALVVWLERYEDHHSFPLEALSSILHGASFSAGSRAMAAQQRRVLPCIFISLLPSGLYQVTTAGPRMESLAGPLQEGMVVSRRALSRLVRLTAANMCGRHRLENEGYCPPHVKRKRKIEEIGTAFSLPTQVPRFYSHLLVPAAGRTTVASQ